MTDSWLIRVLTLGLLAIILPLAARGLYGPQGALVNVRWQPSVDAVERQRLETEWQIVDGQEVSPSARRYDLTAPSEDRLRAIVAHDMVADTGGFDRGSLELDAPAGDVARLAAQPLVYTTGWHPVESDASSPELTWQWTQQTATLSLANPNADAAFYLDYSARPDLVTGSPQTLTIRASDHVLQSFVAHTAGRRLHRIPLSTTVQGTSEWSRFRSTWTAHSRRRPCPLENATWESRSITRSSYFNKPAGPPATAKAWR